MANEPSDDPRDAVLAVGLQRLLTHGMEGLRSIVNASALAREAPVSRDTAYRVFRRDGHETVGDAVLVAVTHAAHDPAWGFDQVVGEALAAYQASLTEGAGPAERLLAALEATVEGQFKRPVLPVTWMLQAAAFTASEAWEGEPPPDSEAKVAEQILAERKTFYDDATENLTMFLQQSLSDMGRRPRPGYDAKSIVILLHALLDGLVVRRFLDPESMSPRQAAEALFQLGLALSEQGSADDPRKPTDEHGQQIFDQMLRAALELWQQDPSASVEAVAAKATVAEDSATVLFPSVGDLADSLLRFRVAGAGFLPTSPATARQHLPGMVSQLERLRDLADNAPHAITLARAHAPVASSQFVDDYVNHQGQLVEFLGVTPQPRQLVRDMYEFASQGTPGWSTVVALLRAIGYDPG